MLKDKAEEGGGEEEGKQGAAERKEAEGTSQGIQGRGLSEEKDDLKRRMMMMIAVRMSRQPRRRESRRRKVQEMLEQCGDAGREGLINKAVGISFAATAAAEHKAE